MHEYKHTGLVSTRVVIRERWTADLPDSFTPSDVGHEKSTQWIRWFM